MEISLWYSQFQAIKFLKQLEFPCASAQGLCGKDKGALAQPLHFKKAGLITSYKMHSENCIFWAKARFYF